jgi:hypothetical protein
MKAATIGACFPWLNLLLIRTGTFDMSERSPEILPLILSTFLLPLLVVLR